MTALGQDIFLPNIELNENEEIIGLSVLKGKLHKVIDNDTVVVEILLPSRTKKLIKYKKENICKSRDEADHKLFDLHTSLRLRNLKSKFQADLLPEKIGIIKNSFFSGNPLRFGEPNIGYVAQSNTFSSNENTQKIIQTIGAIDEDIEILMNILDYLYYTNDYTKKLIGKYIIIELNSMFSQFSKLTLYDNNYKQNYFPKLERQIQVLEKKHSFNVIRNKIAAHRDTNVDIMHSVTNWRKITRFNIVKYINAFHLHIDDFLTKHYPMEKSEYFLMRKAPVGHRLITPLEKDYERFDNELL
jgi:hypothetical protein